MLQDILNINAPYHLTTQTSSVAVIIAQNFKGNVSDFRLLRLLTLHAQFNASIAAGLKV
jgi:hypothetical protein